MGNKHAQKQKDPTSANLEGLAKVLAPEDITVGDYITLHHVYYDLPNFFWDCLSISRPPEELVRLRFLPESAGKPLQVQAICLPYLMVRDSQGQKHYLDLRKVSVARLNNAYAKSCQKKATRKKRK